MIPYVIAGLAIFLFFYEPINDFVSSSASGGAPPQLMRTPRPRINETLLAIEDEIDAALQCPIPDAYSVHIMSRAPLVIYVDNFLSQEERQHLLEISEPLFAPATITNDGSTTRQDSTVRDSEVALVPRTDTVRCIERRARSLQGWRSEDRWIERLRTQRYRGPAGHYNHHFDWTTGMTGWGRVSSFMVWVHNEGEEGEEGGAEGGGTEFPLLKWSGNWEDWCGQGKRLECGDGGGAVDEGAVAGRRYYRGTGATFRPNAGNAVYWENFRPDGTGRGWDETWHAGLPVTKGTKVGLNIWTWGALDGLRDEEEQQEL